MMSLLQSVLGSNISGTGTSPFTVGTCTVNLPQTTQAGSLLVIFAASTTHSHTTGQVELPNAVPSISGIPNGNWRGPAGNLWHDSGRTNGGQANILFIANAPSIPAGTAINVTFSYPGSGITYDGVCEFAFYEFSGIYQTPSPLTAPVDTSRSLNFDNPATPTTGTPTVNASTNYSTTVNNDLVIVGFAGNSGNVSAGTGYTLGLNMTAAGTAQMQYAFNVPSGAQTGANFTGTETLFSAFAVAFKPLPVTLSVTPSSLAFVNFVGGSSPTIGDGGVKDGTCFAQTLTVTASGQWTLSSSVPWLLLSTTSGTGNGTVKVQLLDTGLPQGYGGRPKTGTYSGTLTFSESGASPVTINVVYMVGYGDLLDGPSTALPL
jgi:hypothetical protein